MEGRFHTDGAAETEALGARLAESLAPGELVLVEGELGAGKTTFVRGAARALGVSVPVTSPTFTIGQRDRLATLEAEDPELLADYLGPGTIAFVEWPRGEEQALAALARPVARVRLEHGGGDRRTVTIG
jgi:tRNA threonylcarbamoyladenosine biosynthesis protein TsaE